MAHEEEEQQEELKIDDKWVHEVVNKANSSHFNRLKKQFDSKLEEMSAQIQALTSHLTERSTPAEGDAPSKEGDTDEVTKVRRAADRKLKEMNKLLEAEQARLEAERNKRYEGEERQKLSTALQDNGVSGSLLEGAMALLYDKQKRIRRSEDGELSFVVPRDGYEDEMPIADAVTEWLNSDAGRSYLPPRDVKGSGNVGSRPLPKDPKQFTRQEKERLLLEKMFGG